jgi:hypothetical protein
MPKGKPGRRAGVVLLAVVAVVVAVVMLAVWAAVRSSSEGVPYTDEAIPTASVSAWDDSSPEPLPGTPSPDSASPEGVGPCVRGEPNTRATHPGDGRVYGGNLSFPSAPELDPAGPEARFSFAWDVTQQIKGVHVAPGWIAQLAVGQLRAADGFDTDARGVAEQAMRCTVTSNMYEPYTPTRNDRRSEPFTVSGQRGWLIETDVTVAVPSLSFGGDHVYLVVVPDGENWGFFFSAMPLGDATFAAVASRAQAGLRAD